MINGPCGERYLRVPDVTINAALGPIVCEVFVKPLEKVLLDKGMISEVELATEYKQRIEMGVNPHFKIIEGLFT